MGFLFAAAMLMGGPAHARRHGARLGRRAGGVTELRDWFGGDRSILATEEVVGLGGYGRTLTILSSDIFADNEDEDEELDERWTPRFRR